MLPASSRRARFPILLILAILALTRPHHALAEDFDLAQLTETFDLAFEASTSPAGELRADFDAGPLAVNLRHMEFLGSMGRAYLYGRPGNANPLVRSSLLNNTTRLELAPETAVPLGFSIGLDEWERGNRDLRLIARNGLHLPDLQLDHRLTVTNSFAVDGTRAQRSAGQLLLGFNLFGGRQQAVAEYDAAPLTQFTNLAMNSEWSFDGGAAAVVGFTHRPLTEVSEARLGFRQPVGSFDMTSDFVADSEGGYVVGIRFSLALGQVPERKPWSLSALLSNLRAEHRAAAPIDSDSLSIVDGPNGSL